MKPICSQNLTPYWAREKWLIRGTWVIYSQKIITLKVKEHKNMLDIQWGEKREAEREREGERQREREG